MLLLLAVCGFGAALALGSFALLDQVEERAVIRSSLRQLDGYEVDNVRERELLKPVSERAIAPAMQWLTGIARRFTKAGYVEGIRHKLLIAGCADAERLDRELAVRVIGVAAIPVAGYVAFFLLHLHGMMGVAMFGVLVAMLLLAPDAMLNRKMAERQHQIQIKLPDILDLLTISVEAGLGFEQALDRTVAAVPGPLSDEFVRMLNEVRAGSSRADAFRALDARLEVPEVRSFVLAILQADTFGVSIGRVLRAQADEMRIKRRQLAQERAQKAPVKMLVPMVFCIFPALFVVVIGPAIINISHNFH